MNGLSHGLFSARMSHFAMKVSKTGITPAKIGVLSFASICWTSCGPWAITQSQALQPLMLGTLLTLRTRPKSTKASHSFSDNRRCSRSLSGLFKKESIAYRDCIISRSTYYRNTKDLTGRISMNRLIMWYVLSHRVRTSRRSCLCATMMDVPFTLNHPFSLPNSHSISSQVRE